MSDLSDPDLVAHYLLVVDGETVPVTNLFDEDGDVVHCWEQAYLFVAGPLPNGDWFSDLTETYQVSRAH